MQTFESVRQSYSKTHEVFIESLLNKGMTFFGFVETKDGKLTTLHSTCGDVILSENGEVELYTDNLNPYEPYDCGYHAWFLSDDIDDAKALATSILRMTGDD